MRIIAGVKRGTKLLPPYNNNVRPTADRVKEAIFGRLQFEIQDAVVLDLFAGSGALGLEAVSRGAAEAFLVDSDSRAIDVIEQNVRKTGFENSVKIIKKDYADAIKEFKNKLKFDIVLIDPPYSSGFYQSAVELIAESGILQDGGIVVLESAMAMESAYGGMDIEKTKKYGKTYVTYLKGGV